MRKLFICFFLLSTTILGLLYYVIEIKTDKRKGTPKDELRVNQNEERNREKLRVYDLATHFVKEALLEPATSVFPTRKVKLNHIKSIGNRKFQINSWVDSQDTYGAMTRRNFSCIVTKDGNRVKKEEFIIEEKGFIPKNI